MDGRTIILRTLTGLGVLIVLGYTYFALDDFIRGPRIILSAPTAGYATTSPYIIVTGQAIHINALSMNGSPVPFDLEGNFSDSLLLAEGYNIITLTAEDRYKRIIEKKIEITLIPNHEKIPEQTKIPSTLLVPTPSTASSTIINF